MVRRADRVEIYKECLEYLQSKDYTPLVGTELYYILGEKGTIKAVAGWNKETGNLIEPLFSEANIYTMRLGDFMCGLLAGKGFNTIGVITSNERWIKLLKRMGFKYFNKLTNHLITLSN